MRIALIVVLILLTSNITFAITDSDLKRGLKRALLEYYENPLLAKLTVAELKDLLGLYLTTPSGNIVDLSKTGNNSGTTYDIIYNKAITITVTVPTCADGTELGECSVNKPRYCYAGSLVNRCGTCGCASGVCQNLTGECVAPATPTPTPISTPIANVTPTPMPTPTTNATCSWTSDGICPSTCAAGSDADCCTQKGWFILTANLTGLCNPGCYSSNYTTGTTACLGCKSVADGACPNWCSAGADADCCAQQGYCWSSNVCYTSCPGATPTSNPIQLTFWSGYTGTEFEVLPDIHGNNIVYNKVIPTDSTYTYDTYLFDLNTRTERRLTPLTSREYWPQIYENKVIYQKYRPETGRFDIVLYDLNSDTESFLIAGDQNAGFSPLPKGISGNIIVADTGLNRGVQYLNLATGETKVIESVLSEFIGVDNNKIVYIKSKGYAGDISIAGIYVYDILTGVITEIIPLIHSNTVASFNSDTVIFKYEGGGSLYTYNLTSRAIEKIIPAPATFVEFYLYGTPAIYKNLIAYVDPDHSLYWYDMNKKTTRAIGSVSNEGGKEAPAIYGNKIIYQATSLEGGSGRTHIYMYTYTGDENGVYIQPQPATGCTDSDGYLGIPESLKVQGTTASDSGNSTDYCNSSRISEWVCLNNTIKSRYTYDCQTELGSGYFCSNGACISVTATPTPTPTPTSNTSNPLKITSSSGTFDSHPDIYGSKVVFARFGPWQEGGTTIYNYETYVYDIITGTQTQLTPSAVRELDQGVYGNKVVYSRYESGYQTYLYDLSTGTETLLAAGARPQDISGNIVVYTDSGGAKYANYATGETKVVDASGESPRVHGNKIVYTKIVGSPSTSTTVGIHVYDITTGTAKEIVPLTSRYTYSPDIYGDTVVFQYDASGPLYIYNLTDGVILQIVPSTYNGNGDWERPAIYKNIIAYMGPNRFVQWYDLNKKQVIAVPRLNEIWHSQPEVYENKIVYTGKFTAGVDNERIFMYTLTGNEIGTTYLPQPYTGCTDSDAHLGFPGFLTAKGNTTSGGITSTDYCVASAWVREWSCVNSTYKEGRDYLCSDAGKSSCVNGACV